jgi:hypothetical protein
LLTESTDIEGFIEVLKAWRWIDRARAVDTPEPSASCTGFSTRSSTPSSTPCWRNAARKR